MSDYKEIKLKDQNLFISNNELSMTVDIEEVINQFTADEIVGLSIKGLKSLQGILYTNHHSISTEYNTDYYKQKIK